jgi:hypothetical protein
VTQRKQPPEKPGRFNPIMKKDKGATEAIFEIIKQQPDY